MTDQTQSKEPLSASENAFSRRWNYHPPVPIRTSPFFALPFIPRDCVRWFSDRWLKLAENTLLVVLATLVWFFFHPPLSETKEWAFGWVFEIYIRNLILLTVVAGGLHLFFYRWKKQGKKLKYDSRELVSSGSLFTFGNQVHDNIFWSLASGVTVWTLYECGMFWAMANGYIPSFYAMSNPVLFVLLLLLTPMIISFHFYWIHRLIHIPFFYKHVHSLHHRNTNVGPWSGLSMHPVEHVLFFSSILVHCVTAAHPIHILFHLQHQALTAATSHTGFEGMFIRDKNRFALGTFHHQMHHRFCDCNYGNLEMPWDKWFGSFHSGTEDSHKAFLAKRRSI